MQAAAVIQAMMNRMIQRFREAGAVDAANSKPLTALGLDSRREGNLLRQLIRRGIIVHTQQDTYYLDPVAYQQDRQTRQRMVFIAIAVAVVVLIVALVVQGL